MNHKNHTTTYAQWMLSISALLFFSLTVEAQISKTDYERYIIGETYNYQISGPIDHITNFTKWNFLESHHVTDTLIMTVESVKHHDPSGQFSNSDFVEVSTDGTKVFGALNDSLYYTLGFKSSEHNLEMVYDNPQTHMSNTLDTSLGYEGQYPSQYSNYGSNNQAIGQTEINHIIYGVMNWNGHEVETELVKIRQSQIDSNLCTITYVWFTSNSKAPIVKYSISTSYYSLSSLASMGSLIAENARNNPIGVYPSPVENILFLEENLGDIDECDLNDFNGEYITEFNTANNSFDISTFQKGMYFLKCSAQYGQNTTLKFYKL